MKPMFSLLKIINDRKLLIFVTKLKEHKGKKKKKITDISYRINSILCHVTIRCDYNPNVVVVSAGNPLNHVTYSIFLYHLGDKMLNLLNIYLFNA